MGIIMKMVVHGKKREIADKIKDVKINGFETKNGIYFTFEFSDFDVKEIDDGVYVFIEARGIDDDLFYSMYGRSISHDKLWNEIKLRDFRKLNYSILTENGKDIHNMFKIGSFDFEHIVTKKSIVSMLQTPC